MYQDKIKHNLDKQTCSIREETFESELSSMLHVDKKKHIRHKLDKYYSVWVLKHLSNINSPKDASKQSARVEIIEVLSLELLEA